MLRECGSTASPSRGPTRQNLLRVLLGYLLNDRWIMIPWCRRHEFPLDTPLRNMAFAG